MVKKISQNEFNEVTASEVAVIDFSATWCGPCKMLAPVLEEVSEEYAGKVNFFNVDVDENPVERLTPEQLFAKVRKQPDYIVANNVARLQKLTILLKGVYVDEAHVYFKFRLENSSNVPFDVDYIAFSVTARKTKKTSTQERLQILPVGVDTKIHRVDAKSSCEVIYRFEKFTIGKEKILLAEVLEQGGDRNITLRIPEDFIIEARRL